jgi:hypothetical protein
MPPLALSSLNRTPRNVLRPHPILPRALDAGAISSPSRRGFFGVLFKSLGSLAIVEAILSNVMKAWSFIHPRHERNLALAQNAVNLEWWQYHSSEWKDKKRRAEYQALTIFAKEKPVSYCIMMSLKCEMGSFQRELYNGILKQVNEAFYEEYKDILGEAAGEEEIRQFFEGSPPEAAETEDD